MLMCTLRDSIAIASATASTKFIYCVDIGGATSAGVRFEEIFTWFPEVLWKMLAREALRKYFFPAARRGNIFL